MNIDNYRITTPVFFQEFPTYKIKKVGELQIIDDVIYKMIDLFDDYLYYKVKCKLILSYIKVNNELKEYDFYVEALNGEMSIREDFEDGLKITEPILDEIKHILNNNLEIIEKTK